VPLKHQHITCFLVGAIVFEDIYVNFALCNFFSNRQTLQNNYMKSYCIDFFNITRLMQGSKVKQGLTNQLKF